MKQPHVNSAQYMEESIESAFWQEYAEADNPFAATKCRCAGYDVYGDLLDKVNWIEYLYLLFHTEAPTAQQVKLLNGLAVAIANPGPRDYSVHAAMAAGAGGSTLASALMAALAVGAGNLGGARDVYQALLVWERCGSDFSQWLPVLRHWQEQQQALPVSTWPAPEHPPGFDPNGVSCPAPVRQTLTYLADNTIAERLLWLRENRYQLEAEAGLPLAFSGVAAAAFADLGCSPQQAEMLYLLLRLPGAAAHALEQLQLGPKSFPFYRHGIDLNNDPGPAGGEAR